MISAIYLCLTGSNACQYVSALMLNFREEFITILIQKNFGSNGIMLKLLFVPNCPFTADHMLDVNSYLASERERKCQTMQIQRLNDDSLIW